MKDRDRYRGSLLGLAACDALGTTLEFKRRGTFTPQTDITGGGPFRLSKGQWTDDTSLALCLAESLIEKRAFDPADQLERYTRWFRHGHLSCTGRCFDIGSTTRVALDRFEQTHEPYCGSPHPETAGNGSIMRLAPVPLFFASDAALAIDRSGDSSRTTHGARTCIDACRFLGALIVGALQGVDKKTLLSPFFTPLPGYWDQHPLCPEIKRVASATYAGKKIDAIKGSGYVVESLEAALWSFHRTDDFRTGALTAVNLGDDADTTGAVYGQLAGAFYGLEDIPERWQQIIAQSDLILKMADELMDRGA
jgi:ADP-ribosylglycohydrolase